MRREWVLRWSGYVAVAIVFAIVCVWLSNWQFERNESRSVELALVAKNYDVDPVPLDDLLAPGETLSEDDTWRPVRLVGEYDVDDQILVRNRPHGGTSAFEVLVPLRMADGREFLVNRGWVAPGESATPDVIPAPPSGQVEVIARLRPSEPLPPSGRTTAPPGQVPTIHLATVAAVLGDDALDTGAFGELVSESPAPDTRPAALPAPTEDPGPHLSYAIQWILFALMGFIFIGYIIRTEIVKHREDAEGAPVVEKRRRRDRDADEEDELLDAHV